MQTSRKSAAKIFCSRHQKTLWISAVMTDSPSLIVQLGPEHLSPTLVPISSLTPDRPVAGSWPGLWLNPSPTFSASLLPQLQRATPPLNPAYHPHGTQTLPSSYVNGSKLSSRGTTQQRWKEHESRACNACKIRAQKHLKRKKQTLTVEASHPPGCCCCCCCVSTVATCCCGSPTATAGASGVFFFILSVGEKSTVM